MTAVRPLHLDCTSSRFLRIEDLEACMLHAGGETFLQLLESFIENGGDPNLFFTKIHVGDDTFRDVTCFQLVYLYWKSPRESWSKEIDTRFEQIVDRMLSDKRTDVRAKFTEYCLSHPGHFFNEELEAYSRQWEEESYLLERATIAHYAMAIGDSDMVIKVLQNAPDLLKTTCCLVKGKNLLHADVISVKSFLNNGNEDIMWGSEEFRSALEKAQNLGNGKAGEIAQATVDIKETEGNTYSVYRINEISLMHLAARKGHQIACGYFRGQNANFVVRDSDNLTPFDYYKLSLSEKFIPEPSNIKELLKILEPIKPLNTSYLPQSSLVLRKESYDVEYDTKTRVAKYTREVLTKKSLVKYSERTVASSFKVDKEVPKLNRGKSSDYNKSGFDKGHLVPAADAVTSDKAMEDTFVFTNAAPQHPEFNRGYWKSFEQFVRQLTNSHDSIEVFTGCLFLAKENTVAYPTIGEGRISVPTHFFKVLYLYKGLNVKEKAYILPNEPILTGTSYEDFLSTVDKVQELSGILFKEWNHGVQK